MTEGIEQLRSKAEQLQSKAQPYQQQVPSEVHASLKPVNTGTAVITAIMCSLIFGLISFSNRSPIEGGKNLAADMLSKDADELDEWMRDQVSLDSRDDVRDVLTDDGDLKDIRAIVDENNPKAGVPIDLTVLAQADKGSVFRSSKGTRAKDINDDASVPVLGRNAIYTRSIVSAAKIDGEWWIVDFSHKYSRSPEDAHALAALSPADPRP